jgi:hypothetical protein
MWKKVLFSSLVLAACADRPVTSDCDGMCQPAGPAFPGVGECVNGACTPTYVECTTKEQVSTCTQACEAQGSTCATNGCGGHTYRIYSILEWCEDPERMGVEVEHECDAPIDWQVNDAVKCCCEQEN